MNEHRIIASIQNEIAAAQKRIAAFADELPGTTGHDRKTELVGYVKGLNTTLALIVAPESVRELEF